MAVTFHDEALGATNSATTFSITLPTTAAGDIICLEFAQRGRGAPQIGGTYTGPAFRQHWFQAFGTAFGGYTYWSRATGDHATQTVTGAALTNSCAAIVTIYRGTATDPAGLNGLRFPANLDPATEAELVAFQFAGADLPQAFPATYIWRVRPEQQASYHVTMFYSQNNGSFSASGYYGAHPFPGSPNTGHNWEIAIDGQDDITDENANNTTVIKNRWYTQALKVEEIAGNEIRATFYWDLDDTEAKVIVHDTTTSDYALGFPPTSPAVTFGAAPWSVWEERLNGTLGAVKIIEAALSEADIISEAADMSQIVTSAGTTNRFWFKPTYSSVDDLTDSVTGIEAAWADATSKATLISIEDDPLGDAAEGVVGEANASGNETQAEITTQSAGAWPVLVVVNSPDLAVADQANTSPGTLTERAERLSTGGTDTSIAHASAEKAAAGATGAFTWTQTDAASGSWAYAIKPVAAGGDPNRIRFPVEVSGMGVGGMLGGNRVQ